MKITPVCDIGANYRFTIADNETIARIFLDAKGLAATPKRIKTMLSVLSEKKNALFEQISAVMASYRGPLLADCRVIEAHNKIPLVLRSSLAQLIAGQTVTPTFKANYLALGNGTAAPADSDTTLGTELIRGLFTQRSATANVANLDKFWGSSEVGGLTILEIGTFVDGAAGANTGYLLSRVAANVVVGATETLTCNVQITLTSAT